MLLFLKSSKDSANLDLITGCHPLNQIIKVKFGLQDVYQYLIKGEPSRFNRRKSLNVMQAQRDLNQTLRRELWSEYYLSEFSLTSQTLSGLYVLGLPTSPIEWMQSLLGS